MICIYYDGYYRASGGIETHITDIVKNMDYVFEIVADALPGYPFIEHPFENTNIFRIKPYNRNIICFSSRNLNRIFFPYRIMADWLRGHEKLKYLREREFDLLHVHGINIGGDILRLCSKLEYPSPLLSLIDFSFVKEPKLITFHGLSSPYTNKPVYKEIERNLIDQFENVIAVDKSDYDFIKEYINGSGQDKKLWNIPNWVDADAFSFTPIPDGEKLEIGFVGRLEASRGLSLLIDLINQKPSDVEISVVGAGNALQINKFKSLVDMKKINFYENVKYEHIPDYLRKIDVLFNPVVVEGISKISLEAMSCGRPPIMLDIGDRYPTIDKKTGYLVKNDIEDVLRLIQQIKENREELQKIGKTARKIVEEEFSKEIIIPKLEKVYESLIG